MFGPASAGEHDRNNGATRHLGEQRGAGAEVGFAAKKVNREGFSFGADIREDCQNSTAFQFADDILKNALSQARPMREAPPENMPQPVKVRITARGMG